MKKIIFFVNEIFETIFTTLKTIENPNKVSRNLRTFNVEL